MEEKNNKKENEIEEKEIEENNDKEKNQIKISLKVVVIIILIVAMFAGVMYYYISLNPEEKETTLETLCENNTKSHDSDSGSSIDYKPIIYLYPTEETEVTVKLEKSEEVTCSYPKYTSEGWNVIAKPNGDLTYIETNQELYALYYESNNTVEFEIETEGFVVKGEDTAEFLEEKLATLGLTEREAEEFIVYWLPKLEANEYNYIRFATTDEIEENMPLDFSVEPDTLIRVLMTYKGLESPIEVEEQTLETPERNGFVVVEWGGTEIK